MVDPIEVQILHIVGPVTSCRPTQFGVMTSVHATTGHRMWGGKDSLGNVTYWLALDKPAQVTTMRATAGFSGPHIDYDKAANPAPGVARRGWDADENVPYYNNEADAVRILDGKTFLAPRLVNKTAAVITRSTPCAVGPVVGTRPTIYPLSTGNYVSGDYVVFPLRDVAVDGEVDAQWLGHQDDVDTNGFAPNARLYLSATPGVLSDTPGTPGVYVARCLVQSATEGSILLTGAGVGGNFTDFYNKVTDTAKDINLETINGAGLNTVQDWMDVVQAPALLSGGEVTSNGDGTCSVTTGIVVGKTLSALGASTGFFSFPQNVSVPLVDGERNLIYARYNGGSPDIFSTTVPQTGKQDYVKLQMVFREGNTLHITAYAADGYSLLALLDERVADRAMANGSPVERGQGLLCGTTGTRHVTLGAGSVWLTHRKGSSPDFNTNTGGDTFREYYGSTANGWTFTSGNTQLDNTQYNNGTTLSPLNVNRYSTRWMYLDYNTDNLSVLIGPGDYLTESAALDEDIPIDLPPYLQDFGMLVAQYVVQNGADAVECRSPFVSAMSVGSASSHTGLSNINTDPTKQHYDSAPALGVTGLQINNSVETGSTAKSAVNQLDTTLLFDKTVTDNGSIDGCFVTDKYIFTVDKADYITRYCACTGDIFERYSGSAFWGGRTICGGRGLLYSVSSNAIWEMQQEDLTTAVSITATDIVGTPKIANAVDLNTGNIYNIRSTDSYLQIAVRGASAYTVTSYLLTGVTGTIYGLAIDKTGTSFYVADVVSTNVYIREFDVATRALQRSSAAIPGALTPLNEMRVNGNRIVVLISGQVYYLKKSDLSVTSNTSAVTLIGDAAGFGGDSVVMADNTFVKKYQLPGLTAETPDYVIDPANGTRSCDSVTDSSGVAVPVNKSTEIKNDLATMLLSHRIGGLVIDSVVTTLPTQNYDGKFYLLSGGVTASDGNIVQDRVDGWQYFAPYHGMTARDSGGQYTYEYYSDRWVKKVDMVLTASVTADGATTITDLMTLDVADAVAPLLAAGDAWNVRIELMATVIGGTVPNAVTTYKWVLDAAIQQGSSAAASRASINGTSSASVAMTAIGTPHAGYETPTVECLETDTTGDLQITVGVNSTAPSTMVAEFSARIKGEARTGTPYIPGT